RGGRGRGGAVGRRGAGGRVCRRRRGLLGGGPNRLFCHEPPRRSERTRPVLDPLRAESRSPSPATPHLREGPPTRSPARTASCLSGYYGGFRRRRQSNLGRPVKPAARPGARQGTGPRRERG